MISGVDSATPPTPDQVFAARSAGVGLWSGYLASAGGGGSAFGLERIWTQAEFEVARAAGAPPIAFCSGWDDPAGCRALAAAWNVRLCLDVEDGIRGDGPWVQGWLDASQAGLYGGCSVHSGRVAAFHILAWYPAQPPATTWYDATCARPDGPCGWQQQGSHPEFGADVDRGLYDDWFGGAKTEMVMLADQANNLWYLIFGSVVVQVPDGATAQALQSAGVPVAAVEDAFVQTILAASKAHTSSATGTLAISGSVQLTGA